MIDADFKAELQAIAAIALSFIVAALFSFVVWVTVGDASYSLLAFCISGITCCMIFFVILYQKEAASKTKKPVKLALTPDECKTLIEALKELKQILHTKVVPLLRCGDHPQLASAMHKIEEGYAEIDASLWISADMGVHQDSFTLPPAVAYLYHQHQKNKEEANQA